MCITTEAVVMGRIVTVAVEIANKVKEGGGLSVAWTVLTSPVSSTPGRTPGPHQSNGVRSAGGAELCVARNLGSNCTYGCRAMYIGGMS